MKPTKESKPNEITHRIHLKENYDYSPELDEEVLDVNDYEHCECNCEDEEFPDE